MEGFSDLTYKQMSEISDAGMRGELISSFCV
jgi:hypothetical protein